MGPTVELRAEIRHLSNRVSELGDRFGERISEMEQVDLHHWVAAVHSGNRRLTRSHSGPIGDGFMRPS